MAAPTVTTATPTGITSTSATLGGNATATTNPIIETGVVYSYDLGISLRDLVVEDEGARCILAEDNAIVLKE